MLTGTQVPRSWMGRIYYPIPGS